MFRRLLMIASVLSVLLCIVIATLWWRSRIGLGGAACAIGHEFFELGTEPDRLVVTSFIDSVVAEAKRSAPGIQAGLLVGRARPQHLLRTRLSELFPTRRAHACSADFIAMHFGLADLRALPRADRGGFPTYIWTVNDDDRLRRYLKDARVRAVITDVPRRALELRRELLLSGLAT